MHAAHQIDGRGAADEHLFGIAAAQGAGAAEGAEVHDRDGPARRANPARHPHRRGAGAGVEAVHWSTVGAKNATDAQIMAYALADDFVVLTHDLDFGAILAATQGDKPSVVQIRSENVSLDAIGAQVLAAPPDGIRVARRCTADGRSQPHAPARAAFAFEKTLSFERQQRRTC